MFMTNSADSYKWNVVHPGNPGFMDGLVTSVMCGYPLLVKV
jgi:hypothetical protein